MPESLHVYLLLIGFVMFLVSLFDGKTKIMNFAPTVVSGLKAVFFRISGLVIIVFSGMPIGG